MARATLLNSQFKHAPSVHKPFRIRTITNRRLNLTKENSTEEKKVLDSNTVNVSRSIVLKCARNTQGAPKRLRTTSAGICPPQPHSRTDNEPGGLKETAHSARVQWNKRIKGELPVIIVNFEGVLGNYNVWDDKRRGFYVRPASVQGLLGLMEQYYVVMFSTENRRKTLRVLSYFRVHGLILDAAYIKKGVLPKCFSEFSQVFSEFSVPVSRVTVLSSVGLEEDCLEERTGLDLLTDKTAKRLLGISLPVVQCKNIVIVPHFRVQEDNLCATFQSISSLLLKDFNLSRNIIHYTLNEDRIPWTEFQVVQVAQLLHRKYKFIHFK